LGCPGRNVGSRDPDHWPVEIRCIQVLHRILKQGTDCTIKKVPAHSGTSPGPAMMPTSLPLDRGRMLPPHGRLVLISGNSPALNRDIAAVTIPPARAAASAPKASGSGTPQPSPKYLTMDFLYFLSALSSMRLLCHSFSFFMCFL